ncbi:hypothetical protein ACP6JD_004064 [Aspergillus fumigatus]
MICCTIKPFNMKPSIVTFLMLAAVTAAVSAEDPTMSALKSRVEEIAGQVHGVEDQETTPDLSHCVEPKLCCGSLTTPLDPILDPILLSLGINAAQIVGSVGLLCE